ncbi:MAG: hypothetical protein K2Q18_09640 [Bdellovibrionales bacterium]|nr:hypothetical protein [Bdellovibrionales bacterium]
MKTLLMIFIASTLSTAHAEKTTYEVPVVKALEEFASFDLKDFEKKIDGDKLMVKYHLPDLLTGRNEHIHLEGRIQANSSEVLLVGDKGIAKCQAFYDTCQVEYYNLNIDEEAAKDAIDKVSKTLEERQARIEVLRVFSTDPIGVIRY